MKLAITGVSGFVGTNFKKEFPHCQIQEIDLLTAKPKDVNLGGCTALLHLAALVHQMKGAPEQEYFKVNSDLAFETSKHAKENGVKHFIFMSTVKVYGEFTNDENPWNENPLCNPLIHMEKANWKVNEK